MSKTSEGVKYYAAPKHVAVVRVKDGEAFALLDIESVDLMWLALEDYEYHDDALRAAWERLRKRGDWICPRMGQSVAPAEVACPDCEFLSRSDDAVAVGSHYTFPGCPPSGIYLAVERECGKCSSPTYIPAEDGEHGKCADCHGTGTTIELVRAEDVTSNIPRTAKYSEIILRRAMKEFGYPTIYAIDGDTVTKYEKGASDG